MNSTGLAEAPEGVEIGRPPAPLQESAVLAIGTVAVLVIGVFPLLLGALAEEHRLSAAGIGQSATLELFCMGIATACAGMWFKTAHLRPIGAAAGIALAGIDLAMIGAAGNSVLLLRGFAGVAEGILLWITVGMIARQATPERMAGIFFTVQTAAQLGVAVAMASYVTPHFGANGGFVILALTGLGAAAITPLIPPRYAPLPRAEKDGGMPPLRGWIALGATVVWVAGGMGVSVYFQPLAAQSHLSDAVLGIAVSSSLALQIAGAGTATLLAGRVSWLTIFFICAAGQAVAWAVLGIEPMALLFIVAVAGTGFFGLLATPFLVPLTIEADPTRRAAMLSGGAQLLGSALGPLTISFLVSDTEARASLVYAAVCTVLALAVIAWLHFAGRRRAAAVAATPAA